MGLFNKLFGSEKIKVVFINNSTGETIGSSEMTPSQLPDTFEIQTTMHIADVEWSVEEAIPSNSAAFIQSKHLILKMRRIESINPKDVLFSVPTISNEFPIISERKVFDDFEYSILEDDWRQMEFLNTSSLPIAQIEINKINEIFEHSKKSIDETYNGFNEIHVRNLIGVPNLNINFDQLKVLLGTEKIGNLKIEAHHGFVNNSFVLKSETAYYYGILENDEITQLCINSFSDKSIGEIEQITNRFNLIFINWLGCEIVTPNA